MPIEPILESYPDIVVLKYVGQSAGCRHYSEPIYEEDKMTYYSQNYIDSLRHALRVQDIFEEFKKFVKQKEKQLRDHEKRLLSENTKLVERNRELSFKVEELADMMHKLTKEHE